MCQNKRNIQYYIILHTYAYGQIRARQHTYSHGFIFVFAVNRIACAGSATRARRKRAPETQRVRRKRVRRKRDAAMPTTRDRTPHATPRRTPTPHTHHTPTHAPVSGALLFGMAVNLHDSMSGECHTHLVSLIKHHGLFVPYMVTIFFLKSIILIQRSVVSSFFIFLFENLDLALRTCQPIQGWFRRREQPGIVARLQSRFPFRICL